jgi:hypothetical protein
MYTPKEITFDPDCNKHVASFSYYDGINYAKEHNLTQNLKVNGSLFNKQGFIVCCGDVMTEVEATDFPEIKRRTI